MGARTREMELGGRKMRKELQVLGLGKEQQLFVGV